MDDSDEPYIAYDALWVKLDDVVGLLTASMKASARRRNCARVLCACLHMLDGMSATQSYAFDKPYDRPTAGKELYEILRKMFPEYLSACAAFLSLPRSDKEAEDIDASVSVCACFRTPPKGKTRLLLGKLHKFGAARQFTFQDFIQALIRHVAGVLGNAVASKTVGGTAAMGGLRKHSRKHAESPPWPTDASQLIPHGLERSMQGYAASFRRYRSDRFHEPLLFLNKLLAICGRSVLPPLLRFQPSWPFGITGLASGLCEARRETLGKPVDIETEISWLETLEQILEFYRVITHVGVRDSADVVLLVRLRLQVKSEGSDEVRDWHCGLLFICNLILRSLPLFRDGTTWFSDEHISRLERSFTGFGAVLYQYKSPEDNTAFHPAILQSFAEATALSADPLQQALEGFYLATMARHCCAPECRETFATAKRTFSRCAGCGVLRYCSRECQRSAWKHATFPHKNVCTKLRVLRERTNLPKDPDHWNTARIRQPFIDACRADEGLAALAQECGEHMHALFVMRRSISTACIPGPYRIMMSTEADGTDRATPLVE
ncbi:uncharacterized protein B0H18DRAFT_1125815 [Fomitopsis serialis]|uniref:uncharacterized protein n=1 Tax=Fomitopsis serialis TaxID=139415 RepID=UPI002008D191|nr:uncharacterized protein B0H18DRAFT_1125815 [Neoantrodia serialis]KAH9914150.1 hypothetical protein B0H18DRAFT_1125815 [Neoantrodia serialis]